jgi:hypothetical protein
MKCMVVDYEPFALDLIEWCYQNSVS